MHELEQLALFLAVIGLTALLTKATAKLAEVSGIPAPTVAIAAGVAVHGLSRD